MELAEYEFVHFWRGYGWSLVSQLGLAKGDGRKFWQVINNSFFGKISQPITEIYKDGTNEILVGSVAAKEINSFFCKISVVLSEKFTATDFPVLETGTAPTCGNVSRLSIRRVTEFINKIDPQKSTGFIGMPAKLLKITFQCLRDGITELLNLCLDTTVFPQVWKRAITVCIPKSGDTKYLNNLRPISLLPIIGKVLESFLN